MQFKQKFVNIWELDEDFKFELTYTTTDFGETLK